jgi:peptide/nickel transport system permease protein
MRLLVGAVPLLLFLLIAAVGPVLVPYDSVTVRTGERLKLPLEVLRDGYYGGWLDAVAMRIADIQLAFPSILLAILIAGVLGPSVTNVILTLSLTRRVTFARVARAATLATKQREFVQAARALGAGDGRLLMLHVVPSTVGPLVVVATVEVGLVIIAEASLSFLGLGTPSDQPSWGAPLPMGARI